TGPARQGDNAAIVASGDLLFALTNEADLLLIRGNPEQFELVRRYTVAESPTWAHPVLTASGVLVKDASTLAFWSAA
ncbi:MAG: hypothetical protein ACRD7E_01585, partial [Bryobacteraceae bacterium]